MLEARIAVIGATRAVGAVTIQLLRERGYGQVRAFASARSVGSQLDGGLVVEEATPETLRPETLTSHSFPSGRARRESSCRTLAVRSRPG